MKRILDRSRDRNNALAAASGMSSKCGKRTAGRQQNEEISIEVLSSPRLLNAVSCLLRMDWNRFHQAPDVAEAERDTQYLCVNARKKREEATAV